MDILKPLVELVGTFLFVYIILNVTHIQGRDSLLNFLTITLTLLVMIIIGAAMGGEAHFNPAVSVAKMMDRSIDMTQMVGFITAQVLGALLAFRVWQMTKKQ